jgi:NADPH:quinone reductase-like Zn-dependent oxidoreductase
MALMPRQQKALANLQLPGPFTLISRPVPIPTGGDVLVKIESTGLNPAEYRMRRDGSFAVKEYPAIIGFDGAGHVVKIGGDVKGIEVRDRV